MKFKSTFTLILMSAITLSCSFLCAQEVRTDFVQDPRLELPGVSEKNGVIKIQDESIICLSDDPGIRRFCPDNPLTYSQIKDGATPIEQEDYNKLKEMNETYQKKVQKNKKNIEEQAIHSKREAARAPFIQRYKNYRSAFQNYAHNFSGKKKKNQYRTRLEQVDYEGKTQIVYSRIKLGSVEINAEKDKNWTSGTKLSAQEMNQLFQMLNEDIHNYESAQRFVNKFNKRLDNRCYDLLNDIGSLKKEKLDLIRTGQIKPQPPRIQENSFETHQKSAEFFKKCTS